MSTLSYIKNFIKDPDVAAITPSSQFLVRRVCKWINFDEPSVIVEYGPGTGVFTRHIAKHMTDDSRLILIESNDEFIEALRDEFGADQRVEIHHDLAQHIDDILKDAGETRADYVVSGIPFSFLDEDVKQELLDQTYDALVDEGKFLVYQNYNHMEKPLRENFDRFQMEYELLNIPPMCAYEAVKEHGAPRDAEREKAKVRKKNEPQ